jgi:hypothetical protein
MTGQPARERATHITPALTAELTGLLHARLMFLARDQVEELIIRYASGGRAPQQLRDYLISHAEVLRTADSAVPVPLVNIAWALHDAGHDNIQVPACAGCGQPKRSLPHITGDGARLCAGCYKRGKRVPCGSCGTLMQHRSTEAGAGAGGLCRNCRAGSGPPQPCTVCGQPLKTKRRRSDRAAVCARCYQPPRQPCTICGRLRPVHVRTPGGPVCGTCRPQPLHECGRCGKIAPWHTRPRDGEPGFCAACYRPPAGACTVCGNVREVRASTAHDSAPVCASCRATRRTCDLCGQQRAIIARWPIGDVCAGCYHRTRRNPASCPGCGGTFPLIGLNPDGRRICPACAGLDTDYACRSCGRSGLLISDRQCYDCLAAGRVGVLLAGDTGQAPPRLESLRTALLSAGTGEAVWQWLDPRSPTAALVTQIVSSAEPVSHQLLDQLPQGHALHRLRAVLMHAGVLPARADYLERIVPWLEQILAAQPPARAQIVRAWAHWTLLRRARARLGRRPFTEQAAHAMRAAITSAITLLEWADTSGRTLASLTQADIDLWLTSTPRQAAYQARGFLRWARQRHLTGQVEIPRRQPARHHPAIPDDQRWEHLRRCLTSTALPADVRAAGALILLYGLTASRVSQLRTDHLRTDGPHTYLTLGTTQLRLVPAVATLLRTQSALAAARDTSWLFPGSQPGQHISSALTHKLTRHGIPHLTHARAAALINLAADLPAPVMASLLGIHIQTAIAWASHTQTDWATYIDARTSTQDHTHQPHQEQPR